MKNKSIIIAFIVFLLAPTYVNAQLSSLEGGKHNTPPPTGFMENKGQIIDQNNLPQPNIKYLYNGNHFKLHLRTNSFSYELYSIETFRSFDKPQDKHAQSNNSIEIEKKHGPIDIEDLSNVKIHSHRIDIELLGANPNPEIIAEGRSNDYTNFYTTGAGDEGIREVYNYNKITYKSIYHNIDLIFYFQNCESSPSAIKYDFIVNPGGNVSDIQLKYHGADKIELDGLDKLTIATTQGNIEEQMPMVYEMGNKENKLIAKYELKENSINFNIEDYDKTKLLVIDPNLIWATYYGGADEDVGKSVTIDGWGNVYLSGNTFSTSAIASGGHQNIYGGGMFDAFLVKFNSAGVRQWGTYYGGTGREYGDAVSVDGSGNVYLAGQTTSTSVIAFGGHQNIFGGMGDAFLVKFNSAGVRQWGTYCGGDDDDRGFGVSADSLGNVYLAGYTKSTSAISFGGHQNIFNGIGDAFLVKFDSLGIRQWGTYYGGTNSDCGYGVCTDGSGNVYLAGSTYSTSAIAFGGHQNIKAWMYDAFLVKFNSAGVRQWGTYYGGSGTDDGNAVSVDGSGNVYLAGKTDSDTAIASGGHQNIYGGGFTDAFIVKFNSAGVRQWGTYYGEGDSDAGYGVSVDELENVYLAGSTKSTSAIATLGSHQNIFAGTQDAFLAKFESGFTGVIENNFENKIIVYPNPTENDFYIDLGKKYESVKIEILNIAGQLIYIKDWLNIEVISLSIDKAAGIYLVNIITDHKKITYKLIKK